MVIKCFKKNKWIDYFETYALVAKVTSIKVKMALASVHNYYIHQMDVKVALLMLIYEEVYMEQPEGFVWHGNEVRYIN